MQQPVSDPMVLPESIREATGRFLNWIYNDVFHADGGVKRVAVGGLVALPGFGTYVQVVYEWTPTGEGSELSLGIAGDRRTQVRHYARTREDKPPFSLLMKAWFDLCREMGALGEGEWIDMDDRIAAAREDERATWGTYWE